MTAIPSTAIKQTFTVEGKTFDSLQEAEVYALQQQRLQEATAVLEAALPKRDIRNYATSGQFGAQDLVCFLQKYPDACRQALEILHPLA